MDFTGKVMGALVPLDYDLTHLGMSPAREDIMTSIIMSGSLTVSLDLFLPIHPLLDSLCHCLFGMYCMRGGVSEVSGTG